MAKEPQKTENDNENSKKKRKSKDNLAYGIAMGMLGGTALDSAFDDLALWIPIGVMFGVALDSSSVVMGRKAKSKGMRVEAIGWQQGHTLFFYYE